MSLKSIAKHFKKDRSINLKLFQKPRDLKIFSDYLLGVRRRLAYVFYSSRLTQRYKFIFSDSIYNFNNEDNYQNELFVFQTFIDGRSFSSGNYKDPFLGKFLAEFKTDVLRSIVIYSYSSHASDSELLLFKNWLLKNKFKVCFPNLLISKFRLLWLTLLSLFKFPKLKSSIFFNQCEVASIIYDENLEQWKNLRPLRN